MSTALVPLTPIPVPDPGPPPADPQRSILDAFLEGRSPRTWAAYWSDLGDFARFRGTPSRARALDDLLDSRAGEANALVLNYRHWLLDRGLATATVARRLAALRSAVKLARTLGRVDWSIEIRAPRIERRRDTRGPNEAGWKATWKAAQAAGDGPKARRDRALLALLFDLALRRAEVLALDAAAVDLAGGTVAVVGKGRREAERLTLPGPTRRALADWLAARGDHAGPLFPRLDRGARGRHDRLTGDGLARVVAALGAAARLPRPLRCHGLRHAAITAALDHGHDIRAVRQFSRHRKLETVLIYDDARRDIAGAVARSVAGKRR